MIQTEALQSFEAFIQTRDNKIENESGYVCMHLFKFTCDYDGAVYYGYPLKEEGHPRYSSFSFQYVGGNWDVYTGTLALYAGYWKYEVYEVCWYDAAVSLTVGSAPVTEDDILLPASGTKGVVKGLVTKGKMYVKEAQGLEEVQYIQQAHSVVKLTIVNAGLGYTTAPTITIAAGSITTATATCTIDGVGSINSVTITDAGSGYTDVPQVQVTGGLPFTNAGQIIAEIENTNYIYTG